MWLILLILSTLTAQLPTLLSSLLQLLEFLPWSKNHTPESKPIQSSSRTLKENMRIHMNSFRTRIITSMWLIALQDMCLILLILSTLTAQLPTSSSSLLQLLQFPPWPKNHIPESKLIQLSSLTMCVTTPGPSTNSWTQTTTSMCPMPLQATLQSLLIPSTLIALLSTLW